MRAVTSIVVTSLAIVGCSLVNAPPDHVADPIPVNEFCRAIGVEFCRGYLECCASAPLGFDVEACAARRAAECEDAAESVLYEPRTGYDPDVAGATLAEARAYIDRCDAGLSAWYGSREGLYAPFLGTVPAGGVCAATAVPDLASFFACIDPEQTCRFTATNWSCSARVALDAPCANFFDCVDGAFCDDDAGPGVGVCSARRMDGYPCNGADANGSDECQSGLCFAERCVSPTAAILYCAVGS